MRPKQDPSLFLSNFYWYSIMNPQPPRPPPPPRKPAAAQPVGSGSNKHIKNLGGKFNEAMRGEEPPVEGMAKMKIHKPSMAVGGEVGPILRRPYNHRMARITSFEHGMINKKVRYYNDSNNVSYAAFNQGGHFPGAVHQVI